MEEDLEYDDATTPTATNWSLDYLNQLDTSQYPFPNSLWHVKPTKELAIKSTAMVVIGVGGIFLNSIILTILVKNKWLWSASNYLIGNMALMDLITLIFCPWFMLVRDFYQNYVLKKFGCLFEGFLQATLLLASVAAVLLVSYDRLAAAALTSDARITKSAAPKLILISWVSVILLSLPWIIKREYVERQWLDYVEMYCVEDVEVLGVYWHFTLILLVWIPLGLLVVTYAAIMWRIECSARELSTRGGGQSLSKARGKAMRIASCILLAAVVCRLPYTVLIYWRNHLNNEINAVDGGYAAMWFIANYLIYLNSAINPLIYGFTNVRFRKAMDRTPGVSWFKFGAWCCACNMFQKNRIQSEEKNTEKVFVIETTPQPNKKFVRIMRNILHIKKDAVELSSPNDEEATTKPTKVTPIKTENV